MNATFRMGRGSRPRAEPGPTREGPQESHERTGDNRQETLAARPMKKQDLTNHGSERGGRSCC